MPLPPLYFGGTSSRRAKRSQWSELDVTAVKTILEVVQVGLPPAGCDMSPHHD